MSEAKTLNVANQICGMPVIASDSSIVLGNVSDVIVHPTEGRMLGLLLRTLKDEERAIAANDFYLFSNAESVLAAEDALVDLKGLHDEMENGVRVCRELLGSNVVTEVGELLGHVSEVHIFQTLSQTVYRITTTTLQRFFGGGFFLAGNVPRFYWQASARLIVPTVAKLYLEVQTLDQAIMLRGSGH